jgi:hypothetical protein
LRLEHSPAGVIFGGNEVYSLLLPPSFKFQKSRDVYIFFGIIGQYVSPEDLQNDTITFESGQQFLQLVAIKKESEALTNLLF